MVHRFGYQESNERVGGAGCVILGKRHTAIVRPGCVGVSLGSADVALSWHNYIRRDAPLLGGLRTI